MVTIRDDAGGVYIRDDAGGVYPRPPVERPARPAGIGQRAASGGATIADLRADYRYQPPAVLLQEADDLAHLPPLLREWAWWWLAAVAVEACERLLAVTVVDGTEPAEEVA